jgi:hypothetical protein
MFQAAQSLLARATHPEWTNDSVVRPGPDGTVVREVYKPGQPCDGLFYDVDAGLARSGMFELRKHWVEGRTLVIEAEWTPEEDTHVSPAALRADFYVALGDVVGAQSFIDERVGDTSMEFHVITGEGEHGHLIRYHIVGKAAAEVIDYRLGLSTLTNGMD